MGHSHTAVFEDTRILASAQAAERHDSDASSSATDAPFSLAAILEPDAALAAARRMQRWYQTTPQGLAHSMFGRDGRRVEGRPAVGGAEAFDAED
jgi:hypothetical protein